MAAGSYQSGHLKKTGTSLCRENESSVFPSAQHSVAPLVAAFASFDWCVVFEHHLAGSGRRAIRPARWRRGGIVAAIAHAFLHAGRLLREVELIRVAEEGDGCPYAHRADGARDLHAAQCARHAFDDDPVVLRLARRELGEGRRAVCAVCNAVSLREFGEEPFAPAVVADE